MSLRLSTSGFAHFIRERSQHVIQACNFIKTIRRSTVDPCGSKRTIDDDLNLVHPSVVAVFSSIGL